MYWKNISGLGLLRLKEAVFSMSDVNGLLLLIGFQTTEFCFFLTKNKKSWFHFVKKNICRFFLNDKFKKNVTFEA